MVNLKTRETVIFNQASLNRGSAYNTTTGKFTAPADGVYSFSWTTMSDAEKYFITEIVFNSSPMACNFTDGRGRTKNAGNVMSSSNVIIEMRTGDKVWIRTHHNYGQFARCGDWQWCIFSGFKLWKFQYILTNIWLICVTEKQLNHDNLHFILILYTCYLATQMPLLC